MMKIPHTVQKYIFKVNIAKSAYDQPCKWGQSHQGLSALADLYDISMHLLIQRISYIHDYDLYNGVKVTNIHFQLGIVPKVCVSLAGIKPMAQEFFTVKISNTQVLL